MTHWDPRDHEQRQVFLRLLKPLIAAAGTRAAEWRDEASANTQLTVWMIAFADVSESVFGTAVERKLLEGVRWMPSHEEIRAHANAVVDARRARVAARAREFQASCTLCEHSRGWRENEQGRMVRCECQTAATALMARAEAPITRPLALTEGE